MENIQEENKLLNNLNFEIKESCIKYEAQQEGYHITIQGLTRDNESLKMQNDELRQEISQLKSQGQEKDFSAKNLTENEEKMKR